MTAKTMPILRVMLNKLASDWQISRAVLEDEYQATTALNKNVTRLEFVTHLFDVHRTSCRVCPNGLGVRSTRDTAIGVDGIGHGQRHRMPKIYVSASTQTTDGPHLESPERTPHVPDINDDGGNINEMDFPLTQAFNYTDTELQTDAKTGEEEQSNVKGIKQEYHEEESMGEKNAAQIEEGPVESWLDNGQSSQDLADEQSNMDKTIQVSYLLIKEEEGSREYCDLDMNTATCDAPSHQRPEEATPKHDSRPDLRSDLDRPNQLTIPHIKQEEPSEEQLEVDMDSQRNEVPSCHSLEEDIPTQPIGSDENTILYNSNEPSTSLIPSVRNPEGPSREQFDTEWTTAVDEISAPSGSKHSGHVQSLEPSLQGSTHSGYVQSLEPPLQDMLPTDGKTMSKSIGETSGSTHVSDTHSHRPEHSIQDPFPSDVMTISENISDPSSSTFVSDTHSYRPDDSFQSLFPSGMDSYKKVVKATTSEMGNMFSCQTSIMKCTYNNAYHKHQRNHSGATLKAHTGEKLYKCSECPQKFTLYSGLRTHLRIHTGEKPYECSVCTKKFTRNHDLTRHLATHTGERPYQCLLCDKTFKRNSHLSVHMRTHTGEKPCQCSNCNKTFIKESHLLHHMRMHSAEKPHTCSVSTKKNSRNHDLMRQIASHKRERPYNCPMCDKTFKRNSHLSDHMRTHTGERPYQCSNCNKTFIKTSHLLQHMITHRAEKPYECSVCTKKFARNHDLTRHIATHTGERPYQCLLCDKTFKRNSHLSDHMRTHTGERPYQCLICNENFTSSSQLWHHMRKHRAEK